MEDDSSERNEKLSATWGVIGGTLREPKELETVLWRLRESQR